MTKMQNNEVEPDSDPSDDWNYIIYRRDWKMTFNGSEKPWLIGFMT